MQLKVIGSSSSGNCYVLQASNGDALIIECGIRLMEIKRALDFNMRSVLGVLITHDHGDHCKAVREATRAGLNVYATEGTAAALIKDWDAAPYLVFAKQKKLPFCLKDFRIIMFPTVHDCADPCGFLIDHPESGTILFLTDTVYSPYKFPGLSHMIIEANYCEEILEEKRGSGATIEILRDRVIESHMSLQHTKELLKANDLTYVKNIILIHLSNAHSHAERFKHETEQLTGKRVIIADKGVTVNLSKSPF